MLPIFKICLVSTVGAYCAKQGLIDKEGRRTLSKLAINVFTPALMISKLAPHIDLQHALNLWPIGANVILCHLTGLAVGHAHTKLLPPPPGLDNIIRVTTAISNVGNLPLVMVMSLVKNPLLPFNTADAAELAVSYVMLGWFFATMLQMPLGHVLLHKPSPAADAAAVPGAAQAGTPAAAESSKSCQQVARLEQLWSAQQQEATLQAQRQLQAHQPAASTPIGGRLPVVVLALLDDITAAAEPAASATTSAAGALPQPLQQPLAGLMATQLLLPPVQLPVVSNQGVLQSAEPAAGSAKLSQGAVFAPVSGGSISVAADMPRRLPAAGQQWLQQLVQESPQLLEGILSAPLIAGLVAVGIGSCATLRDALFSPGGSLSVIGECIDMLGQPLIPVLLLVLGANLANGPGTTSLPATSVLGVVASRLVLLPLVGCGIVQVSQQAGLISLQDPLALVLIMMSWSTPTAILVHSLASVHCNGEDEVSALLFWEYVACFVTLPLCSSAYLYMLGCCMSYAT